MDLALALDRLVPGAAYGGSLTANSRDAYDALRWEDAREKPAWQEILAAAGVPAPPPVSISRRQLLIALAAAGFISSEEALAAAQTGAAPAAIGAIFDLLPAEQALAARITWATMTEVYREDPLITAIVAAGVASAEQVDELFRMAAGV
jgi:hypothetical protein